MTDKLASLQRARLPRNPLWAPKVAKEGLRSGPGVVYEHDATTKATTEVRDIAWGPFSASSTPTPAGDIGAIGAATFTYAYDLNSNLSAVTTWSPAGLATGKTCMVHDALGRLTAVRPAVARMSGPGATAREKETNLASVTARFEYDAMNRRAARQAGTAWTDPPSSANAEEST